MVETMISAIVHNIASELAGQPVLTKATWNAICLADFGDTGVAFVALPQIPLRKVNGFNLEAARDVYDKSALSSRQCS